MNTLLYRNISLTLYFQKGWCFCGVWEMGGETYTQGEDFFPYLLLGAKLVRDACDRLRVFRSTAILCTLSKSDRVVHITWSPSGYTLVQPKWHDTPSSSCLLIKMWQLAKAHGVTRNKPKIHVICYITLRINKSCLHITHCLRITCTIIYLHVVWKEAKMLLWW